MKFIDTVTVAGTRRRDDGYLLADARIARTGIQDYLGSEVGRPDMATVRVYRPGAEVFSAETLKSAAHRPVTNDHPPGLVTSANWKTYAVGQTGDEVVGEGIYIRVPLMVSDEAAIRDIEAGKQELSAGYTCELDFTPGITDAGEAYDAIQKTIRLNHVAMVREGRAGSKVRIGDAAAGTGQATAWGARPMFIDRAPTADLTGDMARTISTLETRLADHATQLAEARAALAEAIATSDADIAFRDAELARRDAEIEALKTSATIGLDTRPAPDAADMEARVQARAGLIAAARAIASDVRTEGLSDAAIRRAVVAARLGDDAVAGKPDAYIDARFDILIEDVASPTDPFRAAVASGLMTHDSATTRDKAYAGMVTRLEDAWKMPVKGAA